MAITPEHALNIGRLVARELCGRRSAVLDDVAQAAAIGAAYAPEGCELRAARFRGIDELRRCTGYVKYWGITRGDIPTDGAVLSVLGGSTNDSYDEGSALDGVDLDERVRVIGEGIMAGLEKREIAARLGVSPSRVSQLLPAALETLRAVLSEDGRPEGPPPVE